MVDVFSKLIRLSYYGNILSKVPDTYKEIFPPKPEPVQLEVSQDDEQATQPGKLVLTKQERKWASEFVSKVCFTN